MSVPSPDSLEQLKEKIVHLGELEVGDHVAAYEEIHGDLQRALSEIEGL